MIKGEEAFREAFGIDEREQSKESESLGQKWIREGWKNIEIEKGEDGKIWMTLWIVPELDKAQKDRLYVKEKMPFKMIIDVTEEFGDKKDINTTFRLERNTYDIIRNKQTKGADDLKRIIDDYLNISIKVLGNRDMAQFWHGWASDHRVFRDKVVREKLVKGNKKFGIVADAVGISGGAIFDKEGKFGPDRYAKQIIEFNRMLFDGSEEEWKRDIDMTGHSTGANAIVRAAIMIAKMRNKDDHEFYDKDFAKRFGDNEGEIYENTDKEEKIEGITKKKISRINLYSLSPAYPKESNVFITPLMLGLIYVLKEYKKFKEKPVTGFVLSFFGEATVGKFVRWIIGLDIAEEDKGGVVEAIKMIKNEIERVEREIKSLREINELTDGKEREMRDPVMIISRVITQALNNFYIQEQPEGASEELLEELNRLRDIHTDVVLNSTEEVWGVMQGLRKQKEDIMSDDWELLMKNYNLVEVRSPWDVIVGIRESSSAYRVLTNRVLGKYVNIIKGVLEVYTFDYFDKFKDISGLIEFRDSLIQKGINYSKIGDDLLKRVNRLIEVLGIDNRIKLMPEAVLAYLFGARLPLSFSERTIYGTHYPEGEMEVEVGIDQTAVGLFMSDSEERKKREKYLGVSVGISALLSNLDKEEEKELIVYLWSKIVKTISETGEERRLQSNGRGIGLLSKFYTEIQKDRNKLEGMIKPCKAFFEAYGKMIVAAEKYMGKENGDLGDSAFKSIKQAYSIWQDKHK